MGNPIQLGALSIDRRPDLSPIKIKRQDKAAYGVGGKGFYDDKCKFHRVGSALYFDGEPNLDLTPLNKFAWEKMQAFIDKLNACGLKRAKKEGKEYVPLEQASWDDSADHDQIPTPQYLMGVPMKEQNEIIRG